MRCPYCQHENREGARFCPACGSSMAWKYPACGSRPPPGAAFCDHCRTPLSGTTTAAAPPPLAARPSAPQAYTPAHLAEKILTSRPALEGERKQVTVLFADLKGSMESLPDRHPEEARQLLDPVLERMMAAVHRYESTVNQVMGDGIADRSASIQRCTRAARHFPGTRSSGDHRGCIWQGQADPSYRPWPG
jgi:hypothetical protein